MVVLDTSKQGFNIVFRIPWRAAIMEYILTSNEDLNTRELHEYIRDRGFDRSRASVIVFLQAMKEEGWLNSYEESGKGGMHDVYRRTMDVEEFWRSILDTVFTSIIVESGIENFYRNERHAEAEIRLAEEGE